MGLDMYAYVADRPKQREEFWEGAVKEGTGATWINTTVPQPEEISYWRKHPNLHGWMHRLWESRGNSGDFNGDELELTWDDIERLEQDVRSGNLPSTRGFFFGDDSDEYYREQDLEFCRRARAELFLKRRVFYNSSW